MKKVHYLLGAVLLFVLVTFQSFGPSQINPGVESKASFNTVSLADLMQVSVANAGLECNPGHEAYGKQSWGCGWELICDSSTSATCCYSEDNRNDC